mmetsp:Transcript_9011/g.27529  ORF Transcript_9011/g.27529 Transcript_9011/m.27529 type:complete len:135 (-) Transcript_9011:20-424(-)
MASAKTVPGETGCSRWMLVCFVASLVIALSFLAGFQSSRGMPSSAVTNFSTRPLLEGAGLRTAGAVEGGPEKGAVQALSITPSTAVRAALPPSLASATQQYATDGGGAGSGQGRRRQVPRSGRKAEGCCRHLEL